MTAYRVLARKYRPETFDDLVGQEAMVRTLRAAFETGRLAQAWMLTGIRGTGKTTTARIIAKGLNCTGQGRDGPTADPCGTCPNCTAIAAGQHVDVLEIDAASNTGVQNVRDAIVDTVAYGPSQARYKVFIIDEVHMLSTSAFNALLKTLEEPPAHVKFVLATTDIHKVPVTVLSRCQRFDLRRIEPERIAEMLGRIASAEGARIDEGALALIARAAEGSARDAQSLLDQAIAHGASDAAAVRDMLGLADRGRVLDLLDLILSGDAPGALRELHAQHMDGADALAVLQGLAEAVHWVSVVKITPEAADDPAASPDERDRGRDMAGRLPMRVLSRFWQMLLKAIEEVQQAPSALMAAEMAVIRLTHLADLPSPDDLVRRLNDAAPHETRGTAPTPTLPPAGGGGQPVTAQSGAPAAARSSPSPAPGEGRGGGAATVTALAPEPAPDPLARYRTFEDVVALIRARREIDLLVQVERGVRLVGYAPGRIEFAPAHGAPADLAQTLSRRLKDWTAVRWGVSVVPGGGAPTIAEARDAERGSLEAEALAHPMVQAVIAAFPKARIKEVHPRKAEEEALPAVEGEWDPFEDE